jgi:hypothetical protein
VDAHTQIDQPSSHESVLFRRRGFFAVGHFVVGAGLSPAIAARPEGRTLHNPSPSRRGLKAAPYTAQAFSPARRGAA